jgi:hypothetical protein
MTVIASILGRVLFAYLLVWFVCLIYSKFKLKRAADRTHSLPGMISVGVVFMLPLLAAMGSHV